MIRKKSAIILGIIVVAMGASCAVFASGLVYFGNNSASKVSAGSLESGLIGHWVLDSEGYDQATNRVTDKTPYMHHGQNYGAPLTSDRMGRSNGAMIFDGISSYINVGRGRDYFPLPYFSICSWVKSPGLAPGMSLNGIFSLTYGLSVSLNGSGLVYTRVDDGTTVINNTSSRNLYDNKFHHICLTYNGTNQYIFVDGLLDKTIATTWLGTSRYPTDTVSIGHENNNSSHYKFNGTISDVRLYNRALSAADVSALYNSHVPKTSAGSLQSGLVFDMPLTSSWTKTVTAGSEIMVDRTPYSNNGQNSGASISEDGASFGGTNLVTFNNPINQANLNQEWSVSAWVNINDNDSQVLISGLNTSLYLNFSNSKKPLLYLNSGTNDYYIYGSTAGLLGNQGWKHIVYVFRNSDGLRKIYIDAVDRSGVGPNKTSTPSGISPQLRIGTGVNGKISNVRIYNRALSQDEVKSLYDRGR